ncbi:MAG: Tol-Pal system beta propeller repeat protein TolB [Deltaproteobacteria bacterium]|nr:Tol-Pal system beta propeller repeat protein TolB [Deltaproteobacteria bacterium]
MLLKIFFTLFFIYVSFAANCFAQVDYIDINSPSMRKIPIAIPNFQSDSSSNIAKESSHIISNALDFTGYFKSIGSNSSINNIENIIFQNWWLDMKAEMLVTGKINENNGNIEVELRLFDILSERLLIGKKYRGAQNQLRNILLKFCSEITYRLTGSRGVFFSKIAFVSKISKKKEIYICEFDGYNPRPITQYNSITTSPNWSDDGSHLAYTSFKNGKADIIIKNLKDNSEIIVNKKGTNITPAWVRGKFELTASLSFSGDPEIYLLTGNGKIIKRLTHQVGIDVSPSWAPDGKNFVFVSRKTGTPQLYIGNYLTGEFNRLTYEHNYNQEPNWSPKGDKIAFTSLSKGRTNIFVINADGSGLTRLTYGGGDNESPSWAPDGSLIVFASTKEGTFGLYIISLHDKEQRRLLNMPGEQTSPAWSPVLNK